MPFSNLGLAEPLTRAVREAGYSAATPIQQPAIPLVLSGRDRLAAAQTGTGKTASFTLPILQRLATNPNAGRNRPVRALILTPTRELAAQVAESVAKYGVHQQPRLKSDVVFGGVKINPQMLRLRGGVDILTATPGRLLDLVGQNAVKLNQVEMLVLDEADRMLDMGFIRDINKILALLPKARQNLLFSATFSGDIRRLAQTLLRNPAQVEIAAENAAADSIEQIAYAVEKPAKAGVLAHLIKSNDWRQVLVFTSTKHNANRLTEKLNAVQISAKAIHGNKSQGARTSALADFKTGDIRVLVATDVAARGIDIAKLPHVVNFELPRSSADYVHRIGRTGRAGRSGLAVSLVAADERGALRQVEKLIGNKIAFGSIAAASATPAEAKPARPNSAGK